MTRRPAPTVAAVLVATALTGCSGEPQPDPEAFWTELSFYTDLPDTYRGQAVTEGRSVCTALAGAQPRNEYGGDSLAASWQGWVEEMGANDARFFWETAVEHLCPQQGETLERLGLES